MPPQKFDPSKKRILVMLYDDDDKAQVTGILARAGYSATTARNAHDAIEMMKVEKHHLLVLPFRMRAQDGLIMLKALVRRKRMLPVIYVAGYIANRAPGTYAPPEMFLVSPYVMKPSFTPEELLFTIESVLRSAG